jgi:hypothetical protein
MQDILVNVVVLLASFVAGVLSHKYVVAWIESEKSKLKQQWINEFAGKQIIQVVQPVAPAPLPASSVAPAQQ